MWLNPSKLHQPESWTEVTGRVLTIHPDGSFTEDHRLDLANDAVASMVWWDIQGTQDSPDETYDGFVLSYPNRRGSFDLVSHDDITGFGIISNLGIFPILRGNGADSFVADAIKLVDDGQTLHRTVSVVVEDVHFYREHYLYRRTEAPTGPRPQRPRERARG